MKVSMRWLSIVLLAAMAATATAQTNVQEAFDAIIKCPEAKITESHSLDRDPSTNEKIGQSDIYNFTLPKSKMDLIDGVISAFDADSETAYSFNQGNTSSSDTYITLAVGVDRRKAVPLTEPDTEYIYALFLAPESEAPKGEYRYAYGMNYKESDGKIVGKLVVTYATTLHYRMRMENHRLANSSSAGNEIQSTANESSQQPWFEKMMHCLRSMASANPRTRIALATKAYRLVADTGKYPEVTDADKDAIREILKGMISDKRYSKTMLNQLLNQCLINLK